MNIALIFAGGTGTRMHSKTKPKQFLELHGKAIIIHTVDNFERHAEIDGIVIVCISEWIPYLKQLLKNAHITKVKGVVSGGDTGQKSIYNGLKYIYDNISISPKEDIVMIHDGVRPIITDTLISENIQCVKENGNCITTAPAFETIILKKNDQEIGTILDRNQCAYAKAPQSFRLSDILDVHEKAMKEGKHDFIDSAILMKSYGYILHTVTCGTENIKITSPSDFYIFRAICEAKENSQIWGI